MLTHLAGQSALVSAVASFCTTLSSRARGVMKTMESPHRKTLCLCPTHLSHPLQGGPDPACPAGAEPWLTPVALLISRHPPEQRPFRTGADARKGVFLSRVEPAVTSALTKRISHCSWISHCSVRSPRGKGEGEAITAGLWKQLGKTSRPACEAACYHDPGVRAGPAVCPSWVLMRSCVLKATFSIPLVEGT